MSLYAVPLAGHGARVSGSRGGRVHGWGPGAAPAGHDDRRPARSDGPAGSGVNTTQIPAAYVRWVLAAGSICPAITPAVIAAQDQAESGWNPTAVSPAGAEGIAQFLPSTFPDWGRDDDRTGNVSPFNPADEIMAQGRYDCSLASLMSRLAASGRVSGSVVDLALASYNAGPGAVEIAHGVPADAAPLRA